MPRCRPVAHDEVSGRRRCIAWLLAGPAAAAMSTGAAADGSGPALASYYERHIALRGDVAWGWKSQGTPRRLLAGVMQVGASQDACFGLRSDGTLVRWTDDPAAATVLMAGVLRFAAGQSGWMAIDRDATLWQSRGGAPAQRVAAEVVAACVGDSADYFIARDGTLHAMGGAHRGQYGDGRLASTPGYVPVARDAVAVAAHTGHALHLRRDGMVMGTGGNRFGPLSSHGLGDKADRWGEIFRDAVAIATGSRHSLALRADGGLWGWGEGFAIAPARLMDGVEAMAAGDTVTLARRHDGSVWQWDAGRGPRAVRFEDEPGRR